MTGPKCGARRGNTTGWAERDVQALRGKRIMRRTSPNGNCGDAIKMKSGVFAAAAAYSLLLVAPAFAQGVKIGILNDQSGVYAEYGGKFSLEAAKMAIEDFGGSVLGQKVEIVSADHQNKPDLGTSIARRWYEVENVDMITELTT